MALPYVIAPDTLRRGESFRNVYTIQDTSEAAVDISGATITIYLRMRRINTTGTPVWDLDGRTSNEGEFVTDGTDGKVRFLRSSTQTDALIAGTYLIEIIYEDTASTPDTYRVWGTQRMTVLDPDTGDYV